MGLRLWYVSGACRPPDILLALPPAGVCGPRTLELLDCLGLDHDHVAHSASLFELATGNNLPCPLVAHAEGLGSLLECHYLSAWGGHSEPSLA